MLSTDDIYNSKVYLLNKYGHARRYGRIRGVVFHPSKPRAVGVILKRPDLLLMIKRKNRFLAIDRLARTDLGLQIIDAPDSWDKQACKRLNVDYERCVLWENMPVRTRDGRELGSISDILFDDSTFEIDHIDISTSAAARALLGSSEIARKDLLGYADGAIIVSENLKKAETTGGAAAKAGEAWASAKHKSSQTAAKLGKKAAQIMPAPETAGQAVGKQLGKASKMFKNFKDEYHKASR